AVRDADHGPSGLQQMAIGPRLAIATPPVRITPVIGRTPIFCPAPPPRMRRFAGLPCPVIKVKDGSRRSDPGTAGRLHSLLESPRFSGRLVLCSPSNVPLRERNHVLEDAQPSVSDDNPRAAGFGRGGCGGSTWTGRAC